MYFFFSLPSACFNYMLQYCASEGSEGSQEPLTQRKNRLDPLNILRTNDLYVFFRRHQDCTIALACIFLQHLKIAFIARWFWKNCNVIIGFSRYITFSEKYSQKTWSPDLMLPTTTLISFNGPMCQWRRCIFRTDKWLHYQSYVLKEHCRYSFYAKTFIG